MPCVFSVPIILHYYNYLNVLFAYNSLYITTSYFFLHFFLYSYAVCRYNVIKHIFNAIYRAARTKYHCYFSNLRTQTLSFDIVRNIRIATDTLLRYIRCAQCCYRLMYGCHRIPSIIHSMQLSHCKYVI